MSFGCQAVTYHALGVCVHGVGDAPPSYLKLFGMTNEVVRPPRVTIVTVSSENQNASSHQIPSRISNSRCGSLYYQAARRNKLGTGQPSVSFSFQEEIASTHTHTHIHTHMWTYMKIEI